MEHGTYPCTGQPQLPGNVLCRIEIPVPPQKHPALQIRQLPKEPGQQPLKLLLLQLFFGALSAGKGLLQLLQRTRNLSAAALFGLVTSPPVNGKTSGDPRKICPQPPWLLGRNGIPQTKIGIVDAFLLVLPAGQNVPSQPKAKPSVFFIRPGNGILPPLEIQRHNLSVVHSACLLFSVSTK